MKGIILSIFLTLPLFAMAQEATTANSTEIEPEVQQTMAEPSLSIAVFSYEKCWNSMPEVAKANIEINTLREQFKAEMKRIEDDFNDKYEDFLEQQARLAASIRNKRQAELQRLIEENLAFKAESQDTLAAMEAEKYEPIRAKLQQTIEKIAIEGKHNMVLNSDNNTIPYIDNVRIIDITDKIIADINKPTNKKSK